MNTTESLDGAGKSLDLPSATGETAIPGDTSITENKRRRLVRGAVAFAPLVLTLRSGALAAASCTGLKTKARTRPATQANGEPHPRPGKIVNVTSEPVPGDVCVLRDELTACDTGPDNRVVTSSLTTGNFAPVVEYTNPKLPLNNNNPYLVCSSNGNGPDAAFVGKRIAILSSQSASSMMGVA